MILMNRLKSCIKGLNIEGLDSSNQDPQYICEMQPYTFLKKVFLLDIYRNVFGGFSSFFRRQSNR
jgi:hypothetical protein